MSMSVNLLNALLSLDVYNRGFGAGLESRETGLTDPQIGSATVLNRQQFGIDDDTYARWQEAGFYAEIYDTPYGRVIAFRGTDFAPDEDFEADIENGWPLGGGNFFQPQAFMAVDLIRDVQGGEARSVALTGHSLGPIHFTATYGTGATQPQTV